MLAVVVMVSCQGCWDHVELEDIAWVQAIGFDEAAGGYICVTLEMGIPRSLRGAATPGGAVPGAGPHYLTMTVYSRTVLEALDLVGVNLGRRVRLEHCLAYVFGEGLAKSGIRELVGVLDRHREVRETAFAFVARGRAEDILRVTTSPLEASPSRFLATIVQQHRHTGLFEAMQFGRFVWAMQSNAVTPTCPLIALSRGFTQGEAPGGAGGGYPSTPRVGERIAPPEVPPGLGGSEGGPTWLEAGQMPHIGGGPVEVLGTAVFSGGGLVGTLGAEETRAMLMLKNDFERGAFGIPDPQRPDDPGYCLEFDVRGGRTRVEARRDGDKVKIVASVSLSVSYTGMKTQTDYSDPRNSPLAERAAEDYVKKVLDRVISRCKDEMKVDPFHFGDRVKRTFWTWPEWDSFAWQTKFPQAEVSTEVKVKIMRYGLDLGPPHVPSSEKARVEGGATGR
jgi:spore germination protein KC